MRKTKKHIVVANDEDDIARIIVDRLTFIGYDVRHVLDGCECLQCIAERVPDLLLLDLRMPGMDGVTVLEHLRKRYPSLVTIVVSASADRQLIQQCLELGATNYLIKPFDGAALAEQVRAALEDE
jgi:CheY-like chemotaxis protein